MTEHRYRFAVLARVVLLASLALAISVGLRGAELRTLLTSFSAADFATSSDGRIFFTDGAPFSICDNLVRVWQPGSQPVLIAGGGTGYGLDGVPATETAFGCIVSLDYADDGVLWVGAESLRFVAPDSIVDTLVDFVDGGFENIVRWNSAQQSLYFHRLNDFSSNSDFVQEYAAGNTRKLDMSGCCNYGQFDVDAEGNIIFGEGHAIMRWTRQAGTVSLVAGSIYESGFVGDNGPALQARFDFPSDVAVDMAGNIFVADFGNDRIRKISKDGIVTTVAGGGRIAAESGEATDIRLNGPKYLDLDPNGNLLFYEQGTFTLKTVLGVAVSASGSRPEFSQNGVVSAASFRPGPVAPDAWVSIFGENFAGGLVVASTLPLPTSLGGVEVSVTDSSGTSRLAGLQFVAPGQLNFLVPRATASGEATISVSSGSGQSGTIALPVASIAPGIFSANATGSGPAAATYLRVAADGARTEGLTFLSNAPQGSRTNVPIDLGPPGVQVFLSFFGTGFRFQSSASVEISGTDVPVVGAVGQGQFDGLDQATIGPLPRTVAGQGEANVEFTFDNIAANTVTVNIR